jgi:hypothetical protein
MIRVVPTHVAACMHSPEGRRRWAIHCWSKKDPSHKTRVPYCCNSWRCDVCRRHEAAVTFARIKQAAEPLASSGWCFLVLTLDRNGYYGGEPFKDVNEAYASLGKMTAAFLSRLGRKYGPDRVVTPLKNGFRTDRKLGNRWVSVVEAHRSGWPHVNLLVWCPELAAALRAEHADRLEDDDIANAVALARDAWAKKEPVPAAVRDVARKATVLGSELLELAVDSGWGVESTAEAARSSDAIAGYIVKIAGHHDASVGELAKITQAPLNAPVRFRRLRSGKGFLPPRYKNPDITGCLVRSRRAGFSAKNLWRGCDTDWEIEPVNPPKDPGMVEHVAACVAAEWAHIDDEERRLSLALPRAEPLCPADVRTLRRKKRARETSERTAALRQRAFAAAG